MKETLEKNKLEFPKRNTKFRLSDYYQTDVDEFHDGDFLFLSAKITEVKSTPKLWEMIESHNELGWIVSTYSYTNKSYEKIFICGHKPKPWKNHYHIQAELAEANGCYGYSINDNIQGFMDWYTLSQGEKQL